MTELPYEQLVYEGYMHAKQKLSAAYAPRVAVPTAREVLRAVHAVATRVGITQGLPRDPRSLMHDCVAMGLPVQPDKGVYSLSKREALEELGRR